MKRNIRITWKQCFLIVFCLINLSGFTQHIPDVLLRSPVLVELDKGGSGSGVYLQDSLYVYFVTARHVLVENIFFNKKTKIDSLVFTSRLINCTSYPRDPSSGAKTNTTIDIVEAYNNNLLKIDKASDIGVIRIGTKQKVNDNLSLINYYPFVFKDKSSWIDPIPLSNIQKYQDIHVGDEVFIFGYPTSIGIKKSPQFDYQRPLLRQGIVAGKYDKQKTLILDCPSYYGNSGGPVILRYTEGLTTFYYLIGVISEFVPYEEDWINTKNGLINRNLVNSGYSVVVTMESIFRLFKL